MSQYPYGYGQYPGLPHAPNQYAYPNAPAYPPGPSYGLPQEPNVAAPAPNYHAMTHNAYNYNSSMAGIPGLGIGGSPVAGTPYQPPSLPSTSAWNHNINQAPFAGGAPYAPEQYQYSVPAHSDGPTDQKTDQQPPSYNTHSLPPKPTAVPHLTTAATQSSDEMEEGELSEELFEDLYEPVVSSATAEDVKGASNHAPPITNESQSTSAADTPSGGFYSNGEEESDGRSRPVTTVGAGASVPTGNVTERQEPASARERSGSYSPYLSPRELQTSSADDRHQNSKGAPTANIPVGRSVVNGSGHLGAPELKDPVNNAPSALSPPNSSTEHKRAANGNSDHKNNEAFTSGFESLAEARKEAQKAILKLWSQGVRSEHYIKEGIDEAVVKRLFNDLHLDFSTGQPAQPDATAPTQQPRPSESQSSIPPTSKFPAAERKALALSQSGNKPSAGDKMDKSEERKDRIARLLALKTAKPPVSAPAAAAAPAQGLVTVQPPAVAQHQPTVPAVAPRPAPDNTQAQVPPAVANAIPPPSSAQPRDSGAALPQAALTSQSTSSAAVNPTPAAASSATSTPTGPKPKTKTKEEIERLLRQKMEALQRSRELNAKKPETDKTSSSPIKRDGSEAGPLQPTDAASPNFPTRNPSPQEQSNGNKGPIPGLSLPSTAQAMQTINVRKRPVASDFVDYPSLDSLKRPFGQKRHGSSLVIDVSDGSDDEEMEMDMDMDSPDETPLQLQRSNSPGRKGPSLAEFPPLRDLSRRNLSSPAPSANTPPAFMSTKDRELLAKERAIQEMKRKIAELEAQKKAKKGSQTPNQAVATPSEGNESESSVVNVPRASSVAADTITSSSAQLVSEAGTVKPPKPAETGPTESSQIGRSRSVSVKASRVNAALEQKKKQLAALREAQEAKKRELEEKWRAEQARLAEEEAKMQEEEARLQAELERDAEMGQNSDGDNQSEQMSVDEESGAEAPKVEEGEHLGEPPRETQAIPDHQISSTRDRDPEERPSTIASGYEAGDREQSHAEEPLTRTSGEPCAGTECVNSSQAPEMKRMQETNRPSATNDQSLPALMDGIVEDAPIGEQVRRRTTDVEAEQPANLAVRKTQEAEARDTGARLSVDQLTTPDSPDFSPEPAESASHTPGYLPAPIGEPVPATISDVPRSRDNTQEIEGPVRSEPKRAVAPNSNSSFVPYESPLRLFRAFRFHPEFNKVVRGGVKSLTYSNKIDPRKELCPDELRGGACSRGKACQFQHLQDIRVSDDQILVELGKADDYSGEQRDRFIQGLKELLQDFRAKKTRDFDTIANSIIEYRARFLGDKSKILPLEGVTL